MARSAQHDNDNQIVEQEGKLESDNDGEHHESEDSDVSIEEEQDTDHNQQSNSKQTDRLKQKIKKLKREKQEYLDEIQRQKAEFQNVRKRDEEKKKEEIQYANEHLVLDLLPVVDSFEMAFSDKEAYEQTPENWRKGVEYIYSQLLSTLEEYGVEQIHPVGAAFDPSYHEAIEAETVSDPAYDQLITTVIQKGYAMRGKVIRTAKVRVGTVSDPEGTGEDENGSDG